MEVWWEVEEATTQCFEYSLRQMGDYIWAWKLEMTTQCFDYSLRQRGDLIWAWNQKRLLVGEVLARRIPASVPPFTRQKSKTGDNCTCGNVESLMYPYSIGYRPSSCILNLIASMNGIKSAYMYSCFPPSISLGSQRNREGKEHMTSCTPVIMKLAISAKILCD
jgi:hypothetical protein